MMNSKQISFTKTCRDWFLASNLYDSILDMDLSQTVMLLETKKANPNILLPEYGASPFHLVIGSEDRKFAYRATKACLLNGANANVRSDEGVTPVHIAAMWGYADILDLLLLAGGNPWFTDYDGKNAFQYAEEGNNWEAYYLMYNNCGVTDFNSTLRDIPICTLELKEAVFCGNNLCEEYEAEPLKHSDSFCHFVPQYKSASTQTPISLYRRTQDYKTCSDDKRSDQYDDKKLLTEASCKHKLNVQFNQCRKDRNVSIHNAAFKTILNHRKKTTIYEYNPKRGNYDCTYTLEKPETTGTESCVYQKTQESKQNFKINFQSKFKNKQIRKFVDGNDENWQSNIFDTINLCEEVKEEENNASSLSNESKIQDHLKEKKIVLEAKCTESNVVYDQTVNNVVSCTKSESYNSLKHLQSSVVESNIFSTRKKKNLIKDCHEVSNCEQTSIFSDIDSDISVCVVSGILQPSKNINELLTEDELSLPVKVASDNISVNNYFSYSQNSSPGSNVLTSDSEIGEHKNFCCAKSEILQSVDIQNSRIYNSTEDTNETAALIDYKVHNKQLTSCSHKCVEADVFSSDDDAVHNEQLTSCSHKWVEADVFSSDDGGHKELSIAEEYLYTDDEEGVVLTEKRYLSNGVSMPILVSNRDENYCHDDDNCRMKDPDTSSTSAYDTDTLRKELNSYGFRPGPITSHTKRVYLRKLKQFHYCPCPSLEQSKPEYSPELQRVLALSNMYLLKQWSQLEQEMCYEFSVSGCNVSWREGVAKTSFTYLLLDPRITSNLPASASNLQLNQIWEKFLQAIFYVGKGKRSRPYSHLYQSVAIWKKRDLEKSVSRKVERILDIWHSGQGVVCLYVFQNIIPAEAYTREAAMLSALTLDRLTNEKSGEFYGSSAKWSLRQKRQLGAVLLYRACQVFMGEGERQIRPADID